MPRQPRGLVPSRQPGQLSSNLSSYLLRFIPAWSSPAWYEAEQWRRVVRNQPIAPICRDTLISYVVALDWRISAVDSTLRDELKSEIDYYTQLFENVNGLDFASHVEWISKDLLDLPFGGASEIGRENDDPEGKVVWIEPLDAGTLFPTLNYDWPVGQRDLGYSPDVIFFPTHAISRVYLSPRTEIRRRGWGFAPPERIYLALELLWRGDQYYANLLLDTPTAGILDLGDMGKESAMDWLSNFRTMLQGIDPMKIPVLYEHTTDVKFIPFGSPPADLMFDKMTMKYASIICAGYGMGTEDIGLGGSANGGETLAGTIRQERKTRKTGLGTLKRKLEAYFNHILPPTLRFSWIDFDDETIQNISKARLATATAFSLFIKSGQLTSEEGRSQLLADGLITIAIPEKPPQEAKDNLAATLQAGQNPFGGGARNPDTSTQTTSGRVSPALGGQGDVVATKTVRKKKDIKIYDAE